MCSTVYIVGSTNQTVGLWDIITGSQVWIYTCESGVLDVEATENDEILVGDSAGQLYFLKLNNVK